MQLRLIALIFKPHETFCNTVSTFQRRSILPTNFISFCVLVTLKLGTKSWDESTLSLPPSPIHNLGGGGAISPASRSPTPMALTTVVKRLLQILGSTS